MSALTGSEQDRIWEHYQNDDPQSFAASRPRLGYLAGLIAPQSRVLNIGIGGGEFERAAKRRGFELWQLDPSVKTVEAARQRGNDHAQAGYSQSMPFHDDQFDAVVASELFEHLTEAVLAESLAEIARVLRPGGRLAGTVPAREDLRENVIFCPHCNRTFHRWGHEQSFTIERMNGLLAKHFRVEQVKEKQFICWEQLNWRGKLTAAMRLALAPLISSGKNIVFVAAVDRS